MHREDRVDGRVHLAVRENQHLFPLPVSPPAQGRDDLLLPAWQVVDGVVRRDVLADHVFGLLRRTAEPGTG